MEIPEIWKRKVGPLPMYGWGVLGAVVIGGVLYLRGKRTVSATSAQIGGASIPIGSGSVGGGSTSGVTPGATPVTTTTPGVTTITPVDRITPAGQILPPNIIALPAVPGTPPGWVGYGDPSVVTAPGFPPPHIPDNPISAIFPIASPVPVSVPGTGGNRSTAPIAVEPRPTEPVPLYPAGGGYGAVMNPDGTVIVNPEPGAFAPSDNPYGAPLAAPPAVDMLSSQEYAGAGMGSDEGMTGPGGGWSFGDSGLSSGQIGGGGDPHRPWDDSSL